MYRCLENGTTKDGLFETATVIAYYFIESDKAIIYCSLGK
jgi:hypothetical protein